GGDEERPRRFPFRTLSCTRQDRDPFRGGAHQAPAGGADLSDAATAGSSEHPQPARVRGRDHLRRIFSWPHRNQCACRSLAGISWVMLVLQTTNGGMGAGVSSAVARALGAGRRDRADDLVLHAFVLALVLGVIFSTALLLGAPFMFRSMGGQDEMLSDALAYANVALG